MVTSSVTMVTSNWLLWQVSSTRLNELRWFSSSEKDLHSPTLFLSSTFYLKLLNLFTDDTLKRLTMKKIFKKWVSKVVIFYGSCIFGIIPNVVWLLMFIYYIILHTSLLHLESTFYTITWCHHDDRYMMSPWRPLHDVTMTTVTWCHHDNCYMMSPWRPLHDVTMTTVTWCHHDDRYMMSPWRLLHDVTMTTVTWCHHDDRYMMSPWRLLHDVTMTTVTWCHHDNCYMMLPWRPLHDVTMTTVTWCHHDDCYMMSPWRPLQTLPQFPVCPTDTVPWRTDLRLWKQNVELSLLDRISQILGTVWYHTLWPSELQN